jgi:hypothetical protein
MAMATEMVTVRLQVSSVHSEILKIGLISMFQHTLLLLTFLGFTSPNVILGQQNQIQIRYLKAPELEEENIGEKILCHRPMRYGAPRIGIDTVGAKIIAHNYGQGGSGWTLAPGCAKYLVDLFQQTAQDAGYSHNTPIQIIGAGVIGLFTAYELVLHGYSDITVIAEQFDDLTSHKAGGFLAPSSMDIDQGMQPIIDAICFDAYRFYAEIARGENKDFPAPGALILPVYLKRHDTRLEAYEDVVMRKPQDVLIDFGNGKQYEMKVYDDGIFIDTGFMMNSLTVFLHNKVRWVQKKVTSFEELDAPCIFNCAGLGAKHINNDDAMVSVQGHLILLEEQNPADMNYMISFYVDSENKTESGHSIKRSIYLFPKRVPGSPTKSIGVMGGTFIEGATRSVPHEKEWDLLIDRSREFFGA